VQELHADVRLEATHHLTKRRRRHAEPPGGTLAFMSSRRGNIAINIEGGLELYRSSKVGGLTVLPFIPAGRGP
jgi:hypothetical protein